MYSYNQAGAKVGKRLRLSRDGLPWYYNPYPSSPPTTGTGIADLNSTYVFDNEGRMMSVQYPSYSQFGATQPGPHLGYAYDTMGRPNTLTDVAASSSIISGATYGPAGELLTMSGLVGETRTYNSMRQLTQLQSGGAAYGVNISYGYPSTQNNGKIAWQTDHASGEQVLYVYDALNRLQTSWETTGAWGYHYLYDGFGNLTDQNVFAGSAPEYHAIYDPATNRSASADANGNLGSGYGYTYDVENRIVSAGLPNAPLPAYTYAPGKQRVRRTVSTYDTSAETYAMTTDEVTFWSVTGQKLATYSISVQAGSGPQNPPQLLATQTGTYYYFGGKMIKNNSGSFGTGGYVGTDRLGSIGKFYPYGLERPSATTNGTEKYTGYLRDLDTGLDYAMNRYYQPGTGRFMSPDPYMASGGPADPGSWNRYAYTRGDPINRTDRRGLSDESPGYCDIYKDDWICSDYPIGEGGGGGGGGGGDGGEGGGGGGPEADRPECDRSNPVNAQKLDWIAAHRSDAEKSS